MKKKLIYLILLISTICNSCAQTIKEKNMNIILENPHINANNIVDETFKNVKRFSKEPMYFIRPAQSNCVYEILVNDKLMVKEYGIEQYATPIKINPAILKSGIQTVTVRLYPLGDAIKRAYDEGETVKTLLPKTQMNIQVVKYDAFNINSSLDAEKEVITHSAPIDKEGKFKGAGLPYYEYTFTFEAEVPYEIEAWSKGQDLTQLDKDKLKEQVVKYYKGIQNIYKTKDKDALSRLVFKNFVKSSQTRYWTKEDIKETWEEELNEIDFKVIEFADKGEYSDYDLQFYGNGKLVALKHPSIEPIDYRLRGESGFWFKYESNGRIRAQFTWYNLYLPEGEPLENLRVID
jgi:hypothetical protein